MSQQRFADDRDRPMDFAATLPSVLNRAVEKYSDWEFLVEGDRRLTFADAARDSAELAKGYLALGLGKGARVGLMMPNSLDWVLNHIAVARMGGLTVTLSSLFQPREISWAMRHNDIDTLLIRAKYLNHDYLDRLEKALPGLSEQKAGSIYLEAAPYLRRIIVWGPCDRQWATHGPDAVLAAGTASAQINDAFLAKTEAQVTPSDDFVVICTSGTTAEPKAVVHTQGGAIRNTFAFTPMLGTRAHDRIFNGMPFFWVGGFLRVIMPALFEGAAICFTDSVNGADMVDLVVREKITFLNLGQGSGPAFRDELVRRGIDLSEQVRIGFGPPRDDAGNIIPPELRVPSQMGMTETFGTHSGESQQIAQLPGKGGNWGRPMPGIERRIINPETGEILGPGQEGELLLRGPTLMRGYYKREREDVFTSDGFFRTGDKCIIDEDDYVYFVGRLTEMIKTAGANVAPREVEAVLMAQPEVREAFVFGIPDRQRGEAVAAVVVPELGAIVDTDALRAKVRAEISSYKAPSLIVVIDGEDIPRTDNGKPKKNVLRDQVLAAMPTRNASTGART